MDRSRWTIGDRGDVTHVRVRPHDPRDCGSRLHSVCDRTPRATPTHVAPTSSATGQRSVAPAPARETRRRGPLPRGADARHARVRPLGLVAWSSDTNPLPRAPRSRSRHRVGDALIEAMEKDAYLTRSLSCDGHVVPLWRGNPTKHHSHREFHRRSGEETKDFGLAGEFRVAN